jgi:hypothetical protein
MLPPFGLPQFRRPVEPKSFFDKMFPWGIKWQFGQWRYLFIQFFIMKWFNIRKLYFNCKKCEGRGWLLPEPFRPGKKCTFCEGTGRSIRL